MATYEEVEELRDWFIDACGEFLAKIDALDGEEPASTMAGIRQDAERMHDCGLKVIANLNDLLIQKKRLGGGCSTE